MLEFALLTFTSLFTMMNPIGVIPVYIALTEKMPLKEARFIAFKSTVTAFIILTFFAFSGKFIFDFFAISVDSLKIVGGIIFFIMGYDMLLARISKTKTASTDGSAADHDIAITPLAIPIICGPGAITAVIVFMKESPDLMHKSILLISVLVVSLLTWIVLLSARRIFDFLGDNGNKVLMRIMGLIVMVIAVEFFFGGLKPILQDILQIQ